MGQYKINLIANQQIRKLYETQENILRTKGKLIPINQLKQQLEEKHQKQLQQLETKGPNTYHWYDEPPTIKIEVKTRVLKEILDELLWKYYATSYYDLLKNKLGIKERRAKLYIEWLKKPTINPPVKSLLQFLSLIHI